LERQICALGTHLAVTHRNWVADVRLGQPYAAIGQPDRALSYYYQAAQDVPGDPSINLQIALNEHKRGNIQQATEYYKRLLAKSSDGEANTHVLGSMAHLYGMLGDKDKAARCYRKGAQHPVHPSQFLFD